MTDGTINITTNGGVASIGGHKVFSIVPPANQHANSYRHQR
ncbi:MAG: hypothetical protein U0528_12565 [Anaerolineae bacterium]